MMAAKYLAVSASEPIATLVYVRCVRWTETTAYHLLIGGVAIFRTRQFKGAFLALHIVPT